MESLSVVPQLLHWFCITGAKIAGRVQPLTLDQVSGALPTELPSSYSEYHEKELTLTCDAGSTSTTCGTTSALVKFSIFVGIGFKLLG